MPFSCTSRNSSPNCSDGGTSDAQVCAPGFGCGRGCASVSDGSSKAITATISFIIPVLAVAASRFESIGGSFSLPSLAPQRWCLRILAFALTATAAETVNNPGYGRHDCRSVCPIILVTVDSNENAMTHESISGTDFAEE